MPKILIAECMQEISSFNPLPSGYENFSIQRGPEMFRQRGLNSGIGGALSVFEAEPGITVVPTYGAKAGSAGLLSSSGWKKVAGELLDAVKANLNGIDGVYFSLHGAMGADGELDPEGYLLAEVRKMVGPKIPIVITLDLHGILTERMLQQVDGFAVYHTYPHVDFADTGIRAAKLLLRLMRGGMKPVTARVVIPALVRGDELITKSGCYGDLIRECQRLERENGMALSAAIMIGNPFTDVPELCTQVLVTTDGNESLAKREAERIAAEFWPQRFRMQGKLIPLDRAVAQARTIEGPVLFTDAADATSSGATGDSNVLIKALHEAGYPKRVLAQIVDPDAAAAAHKAGVGATIEVSLGGHYDKRFQPMKVKAEVTLLSNGKSKLETMGAPLDAGPTAVLQFQNFTVVVFTKTLSLFDRAMYYANGLDPKDFDLIVVKSPHTESHMYDDWVEKNFNVDAPGATSANLKSLGHTICARPMYPLDEGVTFTPAAKIYSR